MDETERIVERLYNAEYRAQMKLAHKRIALHLALRYFRDANPTLGLVVDSLGPDSVVILEGDDPVNTLRVLFAANLLPHVSLSALDFATYDLETRQILILSGECQLAPEGNKKLVSFVQNGGVVLSFNKAICVLCAAFPGLVSYKNGETTLDSRITLDVPDSEDQSLFLGLINASERGKATRFVGTQRIGVLNEDAVQVLVRETAPVACPMAIKITKFQGTIFHYLPLGTDEILETKSKDRAREYLKQVQNVTHLSETTKVAWKTAFSCSQYDTFYDSISLLPMLDIVFGFIKKYGKLKKEINLKSEK